MSDTSIIVAIFVSSIPISVIGAFIVSILEIKGEREKVKSNRCAYSSCCCNLTEEG